MKTDKAPGHVKNVAETESNKAPGHVEDKAEKALAEAATLLHNPLTHKKWWVRLISFLTLLRARHAFKRTRYRIAEQLATKALRNLRTARQ